MERRCDVIVERIGHGNAKVFINGREIHCIVSMQAEMAVDEIQSLTIQLLPTSFVGFDYAKCLPTPTD